MFWFYAVDGVLANVKVYRPKSASGKILRRLLKDKLKKEAEDVKGGKTKL